MDAVFVGIYQPGYDLLREGGRRRWVSTNMPLPACFLLRALCVASGRSDARRCFGHSWGERSYVHLRFSCQRAILSPTSLLVGSRVVHTDRGPRPRAKLTAVAGS